MSPISRLAVSLLASAGLFWTSGVAAEQNTELVNLINEYRDSAAQCAGQEMAGTGPLAPNSALAQADLSSADWQVALQESGYQASAAQLVQLSGPADARQAMTMIQSRFCKVLRSGQYAEIGVSRSGNEWQIVLASPLISREFMDRDWMDVGQEVLAEVNLARREPRTCGDQTFAAANPLTWDARLARAAHEHSGYMAEGAVLSHAGPTGEQVQARVDAVNYEWRKLGENVAVGQSSPKQVVEAWLHSPGHCANIMNPEFTDMGAAFESRPQSSIYWTQVFASER
ncbi:CAP domain-containing protein [Halopseudomonas salina]|nr:CAP domain-containing protein [Halopseudomonas salina]